MRTKGCRVSIVIRTRDIERHLRELLRKLSQQTLRPLELVVVDNFSSEDRLYEMFGLLSMAKRRVFGNTMEMKLVPITNEEFSYPYSANVGVYSARNDFVCVTNGHSLPTSIEWLERGVAHLRDNRVAGVGGYALPHSYGTVWEKLAFDWGWRRLNELSKAYVKDHYFSTVNCILRRSLWEEYPFDEKLPDLIPDARRFGGEDFDWGLEMLARGYKLAVEPALDVQHSHSETILQLAAKYLVWRRIRKNVRSLVRPRKSYTRLKRSKPTCYDL